MVKAFNVQACLSVGVSTVSKVMFQTGLGLVLSSKVIIVPVVPTD